MFFHSDRFVNEEFFVRCYKVDGMVFDYSSAALDPKEMFDNLKWFALEDPVAN